MIKDPWGTWIDPYVPIILGVYVLAELALIIFFIWKTHEG